MLIGHCGDGGAILGLDAENLRRLQAGQPISTRLPWNGVRVLIVYGETLADVTKALQDAVDYPLPIPQPMPSTETQ